MPIASAAVALSAQPVEAPSAWSLASVRSTSVVLPVAASSAVRAALARPGRGTVLAAFPSALYVQVGDDVVAVVTSDGLRLPNALVLAATTRQEPFAGHPAGAEAEVAEGDLRIGPVRYRPARWWAPRQIAGTGLVLHAPAVTALTRHLAAGPRHQPAVEDALLRGGELLLTGLAHGDDLATSEAAAVLLGLGPGLTPSGDDLLAGALVACAQLRTVPGGAAVAHAAERLGRAVEASARTRTTALSAALLRRAVQGHAAEPVVGLVEALTGRRPLAPALQALLAVGHTSGQDTARGVLVAAQALLLQVAPPVRGDGA